MSAAACGDSASSARTNQADRRIATLIQLRRFAGRATFAAGLARYGMRGSFGQGFTNVDFAERIGFAGFELAESPHAIALISLRRTVFGGYPSMPGGPSPDFTATTFVFEQRYKL